MRHVGAISGGPRNPPSPRKLADIVIGAQILPVEGAAGVGHHALEGSSPSAIESRGGALRGRVPSVRGSSRLRPREQWWRCRHVDPAAAPVVAHHQRHAGHPGSPRAHADERRHHCFLHPGVLMLLRDSKVTARSLRSAATVVVVPTLSPARMVPPSAALTAGDGTGVPHFVGTVSEERRKEER
uniref:Uncharacterized protein n=1 Tax=Oryza barthii TaxID=65489 RepID=A0A0D3HBF7_9ORYZ